MSTAILEVTSERDHTEMAIRKEDWLLINTAISDAINAASATFKPSGWRKALSLLREWGVLTVIATIIVALLTLAATAFYQAVARVEKETRFQTKTEDRLGSIEAQLLELRASGSPKSVLKQINELDQQTFSKALPALRKVTEQPSAEVDATQPTLQDIAEKLRRTDEASPDYWPTVLQFLEFASALISPNAPPHGEPNAFLHGVSLHGQYAMSFPPHAVILFDGGEVENYTFRDCRIIFTEKTVRLKNVSFINCAFEMPITNTPTPYLKSASQLLLASHLNLVKAQSL